MKKNISIKILWVFICLFISAPGKIILSQSGNDAFATEIDSRTQDFQLPEEKAAREYNLLWTREALEKSIQLYGQGAAQWTQNQRLDKAAECLRESGDLEVILSNKKKADEFYRSALEILKAGDYPVEKAKILSKLSLIRLASGKVDESRNYFESAMALAEQTGDEAAKALAFQSAGEFYYIGDLIKSIEFYEKAVYSWRRSGDLRGEALALFKLGYVYSDNYKYEQAFATLNSSLKLWEQIKDSRGQAITLKALGTVLNVTNEKPKGSGTLQKSRTAYSKRHRLF